MKEPLIVTQADREAAANLAWLTGTGPRQSLRQICDDIAAGVRDFDHGVKAFASHRIASNTELSEALREISRSDKSGNPEYDPKVIVQIACEALARAGAA